MFQAVVCMNSDDKAFVTISLTPALSEINRHPVLEMRLVGGGRGGGGVLFQLVDHYHVFNSDEPCYV